MTPGGLPSAQKPPYPFPQIDPDAVVDLSPREYQKLHLQVVGWLQYTRLQLADSLGKRIDLQARGERGKAVGEVEKVIEVLKAHAQNLEDASRALSRYVDLRRAELEYLG